MKIEPTNPYKHLRVYYIMLCYVMCYVTLFILYYIIKVVNILHVPVSANLMAILRKVSYKRYIKNFLQQKYKILRFKMYGIKLC
jgi:hypothetical protein